MRVFGFGDQQSAFANAPKKKKKNPTLSRDFLFERKRVIANQRTLGINFNYLV